MSITSVINDTVTSVSLVNAQKPLPPTISGYSVAGKDDVALDPAGGQTVQVNGTGFLPGATITFDGSAVSVVTYANANQLTFTSPAKSAGTYTIYVVNPDGGTAIYIPGIIYSTLPTWTTSAGTLGSYYETQSISNTVVASGDAPITYSLYSGSLPTGATLYSNGVISGSAPVDSSSTTYSFTIQASDAQLQDSTRSFSLTINTDVVTWVSPANATTYTSAVNSAISNVTLSATDAAGYGIVYTANSLPTGLSLSGNTISGTPTVIADSSTLLTATANTTSRSATRTINWSITVANDPYFEYNTLLIPGASTTFVDDASTNNFAVTIAGDTKPNGFNPYSPGYYSNYFDGSTYLNTSVSIASLTGNFTIECWTYQVSGGAYPAFWTLGDSNLSSGLELQVTPTNIYLNSNNGLLISGASTTPLNTWTHWAIVRSGTTITLYKNGVAFGTATKTSTFSGKFYCGTEFYNGSVGIANSMYGYISNIRVVNGTAVYTANFTPSTIPLTAISGTSLLTCQSNRFIDNSTNAFTITTSGTPQIKSFQPFTPNNSYSTYGSGYFDGTGDYLTAGSNSVFQFGTGNFTIEAWVYVTNYAGTCAVFDTRTTGNEATGVIFYITAGGMLSIYNSAALVTASTALTVNTWNHVAVTRSGTTVNLWLNGVSVGSGTVTTNFTQQNSYIGSAYTGSANMMIGYVTDVRVVKGTAVYTTTFTPPSAPLTAIANTSLLTLQNNQSVNNSVFLDNSSNNFLVTRAGNTTQGTFSPYGGNWSNYFDGSGDYLTLPASSAFTFGTGDFTIEGWAYMTAVQTTASGIFQQGTSFPVASTTNSVAFGTVSSGQVWQIYANGTNTNSTTTWTLNTWYHFAVVRSSGTTKLYINGVAVITVASDNTNYTGTYFGIGTIYNTTFSQIGYISNVRVIKGTALYTSNFTPSTTPLTVISGTSLLTCQSNRLIDSSINNFTITKNGDTSVQRFSPFNPSSLTPTSYSGYFDGTGDYLTIPYGGGDYYGEFTIECWVYLTSGTAGSIANCSTNTTLSTFAWKFSLVSSTEVWFTAVSGSTEYSAKSTSFSLNSWNHLAAVRSGNTLKIYVNGVAGSVTASLFGVTPNSVAGQLTRISAYSDGSNTVTGYISNFRIVQYTAVYTTNFTPPTSPLTAVANTQILTLQSTTFIDNSTNNFTITAYGNSKPSIQNPFGYTSALTNGYSVSTIGGSAYFDGGTNRLTTATSSLFNLTGTNITLECWVYMTATPSVLNRLITIGPNSAQSSLYLGIDTSRMVNFSVPFASGGNVTSGANTIPLNTWTHLAFVLSGSTGTLYINGTQVGQTTGWSITSTTSNYFYLGYDTTGTVDGKFTGYVSDARLLIGTALYTSNFVPPAQPLPAVQNTTLLTNMTNAGIYDASMMNDMETVGDAKLSTAVTKFGGSSMYFDGTGDCLSIPSNPVFNIGFAEFTIEMWINRLGAGTGDRFLISRSNGADFMLRWNASGVLQFYMSGSLVVSYTWAFTTDTWYHLAVVRNGPTAVAIYINGTSVATATSAANPSSTAPVLIGGYSPTNSDYFNGYIDDLRFTKGYARYTSNFTPPTSAFPIY